MIKILNLCDSNSWKKNINNVKLVTINYPVDKTKSNNKSDIVFNLNTINDLPIEDNTFDIVYSSHTLEHIREEYLENIIQNIYRILKPGGLFRIIVPNFIKSISELKKNNINYFKKINKEVGTGNSNRIIDRFSRFNISYAINNKSMGPELDQNDVNKIMNSEPKDIRRLMIDKIPIKASYYGHVNIIEKNYLIQLLNKCMFKNIKELKFRESSSPICRNNNMFNNRPNSSIYVECIK